jgi:hypothetical protein
MATFARLSSAGIVLEITKGNPADNFHPDLASSFVEVPDGSASGDTVVDGVLSKQVIPEVEEPEEAVEERKVPTAEFLSTLSRSERIAVKASTDAEVVDLLEQMNSNGFIDLDNTEDQSVLTSLVSDSVISQASLDKINALR